MEGKSRPDLQPENTCRYLKFVKYANKLCKCTISDGANKNTKNGLLFIKIFKLINELNNPSKFTILPLATISSSQLCVTGRSNHLQLLCQKFRRISVNFAKILRTPFL